MKIVGRGKLEVKTVVAVCCLAAIVVELALAAEESEDSFASLENEDYETTSPSSDVDLNDVLVSDTSQDKEPAHSSDAQREEHAGVEHSATITTYRPKTATTPLSPTASKHQDSKESSSKTSVEHLSQTAENSSFVTTFRPKTAPRKLPGKNKLKPLKEGNGNRGESTTTLKTPTKVAERRQDHQAVGGADIGKNNLKSINEKLEVQKKSFINSSSALATERQDKEEAPTDANGNHLDQVAQSSAIISAFDSVAKGWTPVPAPQSWRTLPPKVWLKGQQPSASSANSQHLASASAMVHNHPHQASYGLWASQQKRPIPAMVFMKQIPVPYPVTDQKQVPVKIAVPVNKPYLGYISRPYQIFMENKTPYPVPAPYAVENRIPVPVKVPVQRPYPVPVPAPYPVYVMKRVPFAVAKEVQVPVQVPVEKPYIIHVPVEKRVPYPVEKPVPVPVQIQVEKPVPVQVEKRVPVYIERRVPVYIQKLVPYPVKIPIRVPVPVPYYAQPPPNSNQHSNYFRPSPSFHQEPEGSQSSFHQVMLFPKKARHEQNHDDYRSNQQVDPEYPAGANHDENEEGESDSDRQPSHGHYDQAEHRQPPFEEEHYAEEAAYNDETEYNYETGYNNYESQDHERQRDDDDYRFQGSPEIGDSYDEDDDYRDEKHESFTKVNMGPHEFSNSVNHQR